MSGTRKSGTCPRCLKLEENGIDHVIEQRIKRNVAAALYQHNAELHAPHDPEYAKLKAELKDELRREMQSINDGIHANMRKEMQSNNDRIYAYMATLLTAHTAVDHTPTPVDHKDPLVPPCHGDEWTPKEDQRLYKEVHEAIYDIALRHGRTARSIVCRIRHRDILKT
ncbi:MAG: hypothetical protein M0R68_15305 [Bacteroidetes bacterium]|nr:hypothetical protein [Bacteroidota bacterium]